MSGQHVGPYRLERQLGAGNMGMVYQVHHGALDTSYALKVLRSELCGEEDLERFQREIEQLAAASDLPQVVKVHSAGVHQGRLYYVMDYVEGEPLDRVLSRGPLDPLRSARYARTLALGLAALHERAIVHRDVKPANILIDDSDQPRLADFGLAKVFTDERHLTQTGELMGTPLYMAPEQARGSPAQPANDVYALGMVLFQMVAGEPAIEPSGSAIQVMLRAASSNHRPLRKVAPGAPEFLEDLCARTFDPDPEKRPTAAELAEDLERFLGGATQLEPTRRPGLIPLLALPCLLLLGVGVWVLWPAGQDQVEQDSGSWEEIELWVEARNADLAKPDAELEGWERRHAKVRDALEDHDDPELDALRCRLLLLAGEHALRRGDEARARELLDQVEQRLAVRSAPLRRLRTQGALAPLRAGLAVESGEASAGLVELDHAERYWKSQGWPARAEFVHWRIRLLLRRDQGAEQAVTLMRGLGASAPPELRLRVLLAAGRLEEAQKLDGEEVPPELREALQCAVAERALKESDPVGALRQVERAPIRDAAARRRLIQVATKVQSRFTTWRTSNPDPRTWMEGILKELALYELRHRLDPTFEVPPKRYQTMAGVLPAVVTNAKARENMAALEALMRLKVESGSRLYLMYGTQLFRDLPNFLKPEPAHYRLDILREGYRRTCAEWERVARSGDSEQKIEANDTRLQAGSWLAHGLRFLGREKDLEAMLEELRLRDPASPLEGRVQCQLGILLMESGRRQAGTERIIRAARLARSYQVAYTFFYYLRDHDPAAATRIGRRLFRPASRPDWGGWLRGRRTIVAYWLAKRAEANGDLRQAALEAGRVARFNPFRGWAIHRLRLLARLDPPPPKDLRAAFVDARKTFDLFARRHGQEPLPAEIGSLVEAGDYERLRGRLNELAAKYVLEPITMVNPSYEHTRADRE